MQVLLATVLIHAFHPALEDAEVALHGVRGHVAAHIIFCTMVDGLVRSDVLVEVVVLHGFVGLDGSFLGDVRLQDRQKRHDLEIIDNDALGPARGAVNQPQNFHLVIDAAP